MRRNGARAALGIMLALQGVGAIGGAIFVVPNLSIDQLKGDVFPDYTVPAVGLGLIVGGGSLLALLLLLLRSRYATLCSLGAGLAVMVFEIVEVTAMKGSVFTDPSQVALWQQPLWFAIGAVIATLAISTRTENVPEGPSARWIPGR